MASGEATGPLACAVERDKNRKSDRADGRLKRIALNILPEREKGFEAEETEGNRGLIKENRHALLDTHSCCLTLLSRPQEGLSVKLEVRSENRTFL